MLPTCSVAAVPFRSTAGEPLPFDSEEQVIEFLRTARVESSVQVPVGTTKPRKIELEKNGVRVHAIFRRVYNIKDLGFVDSYLSEVAAYELSRMLGLETVPPAVVRRADGKRGSVQLWIENATTDAMRRKEGLEPPDPERFEQQLQVMYVFDNLIANTDRNPGNIVIDEQWRVWFVDHTRSFGGLRELKYPEKVRRCERRLWERLQRLSDGEIEERLRKSAGRNIGALLERRRQLVALLRQLIASEGEDAVLFDSSPP